MPHLHVLCIDDKNMRDLTIGKRAKFLVEGGMDEGTIIKVSATRCTLQLDGGETQTVKWSTISGVFDG